jgi:hypothetical protein
MDVVMRSPSHRLDLDVVGWSFDTPLRVLGE